MSNNLIDRKFESSTTIEEYLWTTHPEQLIELKNRLYKLDIKIIKD